MHRIRGRLTYANVIATIALFIALGGASYAAIKLPKNSVGAKQLKKGAVTPAKLSEASKATLAGPVGPQGPAGREGPKGDQGEPGAAKAWAEVSGAGTVLRSSAGVMAFRAAKGTFCVKTSTFDNSNSVATATINDSDLASGIGQGVVIANTEEFNSCPDGEHYFAVYPSNETGESTNSGFVIVLN